MDRYVMLVPSPFEDFLQYAMLHLKVWILLLCVDSFDVAHRPSPQMVKVHDVVPLSAVAKPIISIILFFFCYVPIVTV